MSRATSSQALLQGFCAACSDTMYYSCPGTLLSKYLIPVFIGGDSLLLLKYPREMCQI